MSQDILSLEQNKQNKNVIKVSDQAEFTSEGQRQNLMTTGNLSSRLMNTKIVRIHIGTKCACVQGCRKMFFEINTISRRDDKDRRNENETPLFYAEEKLNCFLCQDFKTTFEFFDAMTNELFSLSQIRDPPIKKDECCKDKYIILPSVYNFKVNNISDISIINRYDSRSFYRTYDYLGQSLYKIGEPFIEIETSCSECFCNCILSLPCCCCCDCKCDNKKSNCCDCSKLSDCCCCCCCCCCSDCYTDVKEIDTDKRIYIDIFNMIDQSVGKFAKYVNKTNVCCSEIELFYEVYFPPDSNELIRLALIAQILFFIKFHQNYFGVLPGSRNNLEQFIN